MNEPVIAITAGEPAGIGPDLCAMLAEKSAGARLVVVADRDLIAERARMLGLTPDLRDFSPAPSDGESRGALHVWHVPLDAPVVAGRLDPANSRYVLRTLEVACDGCTNGTFDGMATGPVHKGVINDAGVPFTGHTEFLAERTGTPRVVMMLVGGGMRVALATTHLALREVPDAITRDTVAETLAILRHDLTQRFGIAKPRILVAGLNPHAGESGHLGPEEIEVISPVVEAARRDGHDVIGPLPADTLFNPDKLQHADAVLVMYHDQGLPVLKHASFGAGVNVTLGLPIIRTSVDHGTALDLAGAGRADVGSLITAIELAAALAKSAAQHEQSPSAALGA